MTIDPATEPPRLTADYELRLTLIGEFSRRCWHTLNQLSDGSTTRSAMVLSLRSELLLLADAAASMPPLELAEALTSTYAVAAAISCRRDDLDQDRSGDILAVGESLVDLELNLDSQHLLAGLEPDDRAAAIGSVPSRISAVAELLCSGEDTSDLAACIAIVAGSAT